jgi:Leucine-rich repeat (LRR) protein
MKLTELSNDALFSLSIQLNLEDLLRFCSSSKKINDVVCQKDNVWLYKLNKEFPNWQELHLDSTIKNPITLFPIIEAKSPKDIYVTLHYWNMFTIFRKKLKIKYSLYEIYSLKYLFLSDRMLTEIPKEIGKLINLQYLNINNNKLTIIPKEIGKLTNLQELRLGNNSLTKLPKEIGKLTKLRVLNLAHNTLTQIPSEIGKLKNLETLYLNDNNLIEIPQEIQDIKGLTIYK